jgi:CO/xanthine dehydrogenase Mo-binding subunit
VKIAAEEAKRQVLEAAAEFYKTHPEDFEIKDSVIRSKVSADRGLSLKDLANHVYYSRKAGEPRAIIGKGSWDAPTVILDERGGHYAPNYAFSAVAVKVKVDPETGRVAVLDIASAHDVGKAIDREAVEGQIQGGVCQGLGYALFENMFFDKMGHSLNPSFLDYIIPTMADLPDISAIIVESGEDREVPTGVKGVGETGLVCVAAAIANAVYDAVGVRITDLPLTAEKIALAISKKGKRKDS